LRLQKIVQKVYEILAAGRLVRVKCLLESQVNEEVCERAVFARFNETVPEGLAVFLLLFHALIVARTVPNKKYRFRAKNGT
jgi:hypothetical protein